ncbi:MAG: pantoate--beta-alanine ligase [Marinilabiliaceae bacterium]|nr:pantoate--beta-alanine ligase [Marinilabiliaceae bacterium]
MEIVKTVIELQSYLKGFREKKNSIGLVPTMGALHRGHLTLVKQAKEHCSVVVASIFVNPTQFNNPNDLQRYPRDLKKDCDLLETEGCDVVFAPDVTEVYPEKDERIFDFGDLENVMEGKYRPGHFNGVAQVVSRLFELVRPDKAFFGLKDFQQLAIVREMVSQLNFSVDIIPCETVRESDGLAMSSRNMLLTNQQRKNAPVIAKTLFESCNFASGKTVKETIDYVVSQVNEVEGLEVEYFDIADGYSLKAIDKWNESEYIVGCIAVFAGEIRLIDNVIYKNTGHEC